MGYNFLFPVGFLSVSQMNERVEPDHWRSSNTFYHCPYIAFTFQSIFRMYLLLNEIVSETISVSCQYLNAVVMSYWYNHNYHFLTHFSHIHLYADGGGGHVRCQPAHEEQFGVQYYAQGHPDMQTRGIKPETFRLYKTLALPPEPLGCPSVGWMDRSLTASLVHLFIIQ